MTAWTIAFDVAFDTNPDDTPGAGDWTDLGDRLQALDLTTGAPGMSDATAILKNQDRHLDPTNGSSPYNLVPMRHVRIRATIGSTTYNLYRGFVETWSPTWPDQTRHQITVRLVDGFAWLALQDVEDIDLERQTTGERIGAVLDLAGWPDSLRDISVGVVTVEAVEREAANLLHLLEDAADSEDGSLYIAPDGKVTFRDRHARFDQSSLATISSGVVDASPVYDTSRLVNIGLAELADGTAFEHRDDSSVAAYGPRVGNIRDLPVLPVEAEALAQWQVVRFAEPAVWVDGLTMSDRRDGTLPSRLVRTIGDLVTFSRSGPDGGTIEIVGHIERVTQRVTLPGKTWETVWDLSPYFGEGPWMVLDSNDPDMVLDGAAKLVP